ncbi:MAG: hypothetical protein KAH17_05480 [Bacteroidales bacterium]|nr:hypothetical protein [Bacteroidales bacterium]
MKTFLNRVLLIVLILLATFSCEPEVITNPDIDNTYIPTGILEVNFEIKHIWMPTDRIVRVGLHVAEEAQLLYQGNYIQSANVTDNMPFYSFHLPPGSYYYEAIIACICSGDSCSAGGFPGNQFAQKHTMGKFIIYDKEKTLVTPTFQ